MFASVLDCVPYLSQSPYADDADVESSLEGAPVLQRGVHSDAGATDGSSRLQRVVFRNLQTSPNSQLTMIFHLQGLAIRWELRRLREFRLLSPSGRRGRGPPFSRSLHVQVP